MEYDRTLEMSTFCSHKYRCWYEGRIKTQNARAAVKIIHGKRGGVLLEHS